MKISLNWLKQYVDLPKNLSPEELALKLTMSIVEVEEVIDLGGQLNDVYVGKVVKIIKHPAADKLSVAEVDIGKKKIQLIFGQLAEVHEGDLVPVAQAPTTLPTGIQIEAKEIRGVQSEGMLCLDSELMADGEAKLNYFPAGTKVGSLVKDVLGLADVIFEIDNKSITHRPDLWGHYGMAREAAAILGLKLKPLKLTDYQEGQDADLTIKLEDKENCSRYIGALVGNIKIEPSPLWLRHLLKSVGVRPINNIVDITNYVMLELGRPAHAFDRHDVMGDTIIARRAKEGEKFTTLDGQTRTLTSKMCLICDSKRAIDLAGIMGGENSEIKDETTEILLELANFNPSNIRRTSTALGLRTDAAARFEKGLDPDLARLGLDRIMTLILEFIPEAKLLSRVVDVNYDSDQSREIDLGLDFLEKRIGQAIPKKEVIRILESLSFEVKDKKDSLLVKPPQFRTKKDISLPEDLVEEVARIYGFDNIEPAMPMVAMEPPADNPSQALERQIKAILTQTCQATEIYNYSFTGQKNLTILGLDEKDYWQLKNYFSEDQKYLRKNLFENLIVNLEDNLRFFGSFSLFELGRVYLKETGEFQAAKDSQEFLAKQPKLLAGLMVGEDQAVFFKAKGLAETLLDVLEIKYNYSNKAKPAFKWLDNQAYLEILAGDQVLGWLSLLDRKVLNRLNLNKSAAVWQFSFEALLKQTQDSKKYWSLAKYPGMTYDFSVAVDQKLAWAQLRQEVLELSPLIKRVELFDLYQQGQFSSGKKSLAFHVDLLDETKTLTAQAGDSLKNQIINLLKKKFKAEVR